MSSVYHSTAEEGIRPLQVAPEPVRERSDRPFDAFLESSSRHADFSRERDSRVDRATKDRAVSRLEESIGNRRGSVRNETLRASRRDDAEGATAVIPADAPPIRSADRDASDKPADGGIAAETEDVRAADAGGATGNSAAEGNDDNHQASHAQALPAEANALPSALETEGTTPVLVKQAVFQPVATGEGPQVTTRLVAAGELTGNGAVTTPFQPESGGFDQIENGTSATPDQHFTLAAEFRAGQPTEATLFNTTPTSTADASSQPGHSIVSGDPAVRQDAPSTAAPLGDGLRRRAARANASGILVDSAIGPATFAESTPAVEAAVDASVAETVSDEAASRNSDATQQSGTTTASSGSDPRGEGRNPLSGRAEHAAAGKGALGSADASRFVTRVSRAVEIAHQRGESLQIRLSPPELGSLRVEIAVRNGLLTAHLEAETPAARIALLDSLPALRERLAEQSVRVERFDVDVRDESGGRFHDGAPSFNDHRRSASQRPDRELRTITTTVGAGRSGARPVLTYHGGGRINLVV